MIVRTHYLDSYAFLIKIKAIITREERKRRRRRRGDLVEIEETTGSDMEVRNGMKSLICGARWAEQPRLEGGDRRRARCNPPEHCRNWEQIYSLHHSNYWEQESKTSLFFKFGPIRLSFWAS